MYRRRRYKLNKKLASSPSLSEIITLLKANIPYDLIMQWDWRLRAAAIIVIGKMDGGEFSWERLQWLEQNSE